VNAQYVDTVRLLLAIVPAIFQSPRFAMKGGTAINLFVQDFPRLSVDIDVVFTDHSIDRDGALQAIAADLAAARSAIVGLGYRAQLPRTKAGDDVKLLVETSGARVKVEVNFVFRGTLLPVVRTHLTEAAQDLFTTDVEVPVLDRSELYGSKLVAAMDLFGWQPGFVDCFVAYLAGHNRPVHEVLFPRKLPLNPTFDNEFVGMTRAPIDLATLQQVQDRLVDELPRALTSAHREFLLSLVCAEPRWDLMPFARLAQLPALQWKLLNLRNLRSRNRRRFEQQHETLAAKLESL
jgi:hypothetical protein